MSVAFRMRRQRGGNSLVELVVATLIVGVLLVAALQAVGQSLLSQARTADLVQSQALARTLLAEILDKSYQEPGSTNPPIGLDTGETAGNRNTYDDADDYHGLSESPPAGADGIAIAAYAGWTRNVTVTWVDPATLVQTGAESGAKKIIVSMTHNGIAAGSAIGYRTSAP
jgi:type II secretory pathway pseudopilin PulG